MNESEPTHFEPRAWLLVFHRKARTAWVNRWVPGRFKHVSAIGFIPAARAWVFYDVELGRTKVEVLPAGQPAIRACGEKMAGNAVLRFDVRERKRRMARVGFWCVPAVKHLVGLHSGALLPTTLWEHCIAAGAEVIFDGGFSTDHHVEHNSVVTNP